MNTQYHSKICSPLTRTDYYLFETLEKNNLKNIMDFKEIRLYDDKSFEDLIKDIYEEHINKRDQINELVTIISK